MNLLDEHLRRDFVALLAAGRERCDSDSMTTDDETHLGKIDASFRKPHEPILGAGATVEEFWAWAYSDLLANATRGVLAEFLVTRALDAVKEPRDIWAPFDVTDRAGTTIEVRSTGYLQSWEQGHLSNIALHCAPTRLLDPVTRDYVAERRRQAKLYVLCVLTPTDANTIDPLDTSQWDFYVVPTAFLDAQYPEAKSIRLAVLRKTRYGTPFRYGQLADAVHRLGEPG